MMKIGIQTWGSEGDIRPFLALAHGLAEQGHEIELAYTSVQNRDYQDHLGDSAITLHKVGAFNHSKAQLEAISQQIFHSRLVANQLKTILENFFDPVADAMYDAAERLCQECDLVIGHFLLTPFTTAVEQHDIPSVLLATVPHLPTREAPPTGLPDWGPLANRLMWKLGEAGIDLGMGRPINAMRARHGATHLRHPSRLLHQADRLLTCVSPTLFPRPKDWPPEGEVSGFLELAAERLKHQLPDSLRAFFAAGEAPIFIGFGSLSDFDPTPQKSVDLLCKAVALTGSRAIIQARWQQLNPCDNPAIYPLEHAPHDLVMPHCSGIVHHGGAGTTQAAVRARRPSLVVPHMVDQFFWGQRLEQLGVALPSLPARKLTAKRLAERLSQFAQRDDLQHNAASLGKALEEEDGVRRTVALIEQLGAERGLS